MWTPSGLTEIVFPLELDLTQVDLYLITTSKTKKGIHNAIKGVHSLYRGVLLQYTLCDFRKRKDKNGNENSSTVSHPNSSNSNFNTKHIFRNKTSSRAITVLNNSQPPCNLYGFGIVSMPTEIMEQKSNLGVVTCM